MPAPLFLIGFMAAGKTSVGRSIARAQGRRFVDLDDEIAAMGEPVADLVARDEAELRRREASALAAAIDHADDGPVIATGGGAASFGDNLDRMRAAGLVIALGVDVAEARVRAERSGGTRPLLAQAEALAARRASSYRRAHAVVSTVGRTIDEVTAEVAAVERAWTALPVALRDCTVVALGARSYPIVVRDHVELGEALRAASCVAVITDGNVDRLWGDAVKRAIGRDVVELVIEPGEASKSFATYERLCAELVARGLDRGSVIVALGGGVVGDLAGFVAATLFRGIPVVQVPTTLVAMTDAAIGGKTAVDLAAGKNLVGAFHQPRLVTCALPTLATLPARERRAGFGELWKYALLDGRELWRAVDACAPWASGGGNAPGELRDVIARSVAYKAAVVGRDELERTGHRVLLNLGHTIGHAIETHSGLLHGEAVGLGLVAACRVSAALGLARPELEAEVVEALRRTGMPVDLDRHLVPAVLDHVRVDKKRTADNVRFIAIREVGSCEPIDVPIVELGRILRATTAP
ncbi:MAG TPA: 3-dehydroquinate synthase [Kofleriaceae bacterium]|jgi:shikimate kinase/3-dehydroquinate synthase